MTGGEVETYLYNGVKTLEPPITGKVYYRGMRPLQNDKDSDKEDCVVAVTTGTGLQVERGTCVVNVYVPDIRVPSGAYMRDKGRCDIIEKWLDGVPRRLTAMGDVFFERQSLILTLEEPALREHFVSLKMDFRLLTN